MLDDNVRRRVKRLVEDGHPGQALRIITSSGVYDSEDPLITAILRDLHPPEGAQILRTCPEPNSLKFAVSADAVTERLRVLEGCIASFSTTSAPIRAVGSINHPPGSLPVVSSSA